LKEEGISTRTSGWAKEAPGNMSHMAPSKISVSQKKCLLCLRKPILVSMRL
jgi:hypothetical protein